MQSALYDGGISSIPRDVEADASDRSFLDVGMLATLRQVLRFDLFSFEIMVPVKVTMTGVG